MDPATFATELGILAVRGFGDMGRRARDLMVRNKFIAAQQSCELRRYLDGASSDAPIREIVDSCRVWESHSDQEPSLKVDRGCDSLGVSGESGTVGCLRTEMQELPACSGMGSRVPGIVVGVDPRSGETPREMKEGVAQVTSLETISSLVSQLLRTVQEGRQVDDIRLGRGRWGVSADLTGLQMNRLFCHWGATLQRIADDMNVHCWMALTKCWEVGHQGCRSLLWRWVEVLCQWLPRCLELVNMGGGCGLLERVGRYHSKLWLT